MLLMYAIISGVVNILIYLSIGLYTFAPFDRNEINELVNEVVENTRRLLEAASKEMDKWRRN